MTPDKQEDNIIVYINHTPFKISNKKAWSIYFSFDQDAESAKELFQKRLLEEIENRINYHAQSGSISSDRKISECNWFRELILTIKP